MKILRTTTTAVALSAAFLLVAHSASAQQVIYNNIPSSIPGPNVASFPFQAGQEAELGDVITFGGTARGLSSVDVLVSNWAYQSEWSSYANANASGYFVPLTFNIYNVGAGNSVGTLLATMTQNTLIPWRAEPNPGQCGALSDYSTFHEWYGDDNACHGGESFQLSFDFSAQGIVLPEQVVYGLAFNTQTWGYSPTGVDAPYNSLNFGASLDAPTVGSSAAGVGADAWGSTPVFETSSGWTYKSMAEFRANDIGTPSAVTPEPATMTLVGMGLVGLVGARRRKRSR